MLLITALIFILIEAIGEGLLIRKNYSINEIIFDGWVQWVIAIMLFSVWFIIAFNFTSYYVPVWKMIAGFISVRFLTFDVAYNLSAGNKWYYYGSRKWYDRTMEKLGSWGWMVKVICGIMGFVFLLGYE